MNQVPELQIPMDELRGRSLFIGTPMYGGQCAGLFAHSTAQLAALCQAQGIRLTFYYMYNESLITRARNYVCDEFMRSDCSHLLFIDSDIGFNPMDVLGMLALQGPESPYDVIAAPYPKKCISWEKIKTAVDKGAADKDPNLLERFVGDYVFNPKSNTREIPLNQPVQVLEAGTGFMMIRRKTLEDYTKAYPHLMYRPDHVRTAAFDGSREIMAFFDCVICPDTKRYLSEDYMFCQYVNKMGGSTWFCPWIELKHVGSYIFGGSLKDLAMIGATPTADVDQLRKNRR